MLDVVKYEIDKLPAFINIGLTGEESFREVQIDMTKWMAAVSDCTPKLVHIRPGETEADAYFAETTFDSETNILSWVITMNDLGSIEGNGVMQVWLEKLDGDTVLIRGKSAKTATRIGDAIQDGADTEPPARSLLFGLTAEVAGLAEGASPTVEVEHDGHYGEWNLKFGIPKGDKGDKGDPGPTGPIAGISMNGSELTPDANNKINLGTVVTEIVDGLNDESTTKALSAKQGKVLKAAADDKPNIDGMAILSDNDSHIAITAGQYVYVRNHSTLEDGLYRATVNISADGALSGSVEAVSDGLGGAVSSLEGKVGNICAANKLLTSTTDGKCSFTMPDDTVGVLLIGVSAPITISMSTGTVLYYSTVPTGYTLSQSGNTVTVTKTSSISTAVYVTFIIIS